MCIKLTLLSRRFSLYHLPFYKNKHNSRYVKEQPESSVKQTLILYCAETRSLHLQRDTI